jgi:hypothetical protein
MAIKLTENQSTGNHGHLQWEESAGLTQHVAVSALYASYVLNK